MRLAILIALSADRRQARALGDPLPYDAAQKALRGITPETAPAPIVQVWEGNRVKEKTFREVKELEAPVAAGEELTAVLAANEAMQAQLAEVRALNDCLRAELKALRGDLETAPETEPPSGNRRRK